VDTKVQKNVMFEAVNQVKVQKNVMFEAVNQVIDQRYK
jgi:hypothetical protein